MKLAVRHRYHDVSGLLEILSKVGSWVDISLAETQDSLSISPTKSLHYFHVYEDTLKSLLKNVKK